MVSFILVNRSLVTAEYYCLHNNVTVTFLKFILYIWVTYGLSSGPRKQM